MTIILHDGEHWKSAEGHRLKLCEMEMRFENRMQDKMR